MPSIEPLAIIHPQGVKAKIFYTAYQSFGYGIAVPADSPIQDFKDLKGKIDDLGSKHVFGLWRKDDWRVFVDIDRLDGIASVP